MWARSLAVLAFSAVVSAAAAAAGAPLEAYGKLPFIEEAAISPDGTRLAYSLTDGEQRKVIIKDAATGALVGGLNAGTRKLRAIQWAGSNHLIVTTSVTGGIPFIVAPRSEWRLAIDYDLVHKRQTDLLSRVRAGQPGEQTLNIIESRPEIRMIGGHPYALVQGTDFVDSKGREGLFKVDLDHGDTANLVFEGFEHTLAYVIGPTGDPLAESEYVGEPGRWILRVRHGVGWTTATREGAPIETPYLQGLNPDGTAIRVGFFSEKGDQVRDLSLDGKTWGPASPAPDWTIQDPLTGRLIGQGSLTGETLKMDFVDPHDQAMWVGVSRAYAGAFVTLVSMSEDHQRLIVRVDSPTEGPAYALVDRTRHKGDWIAEEYENLGEKDIAAKQSVAFKAADGFALSGYLTLPNGRPAKGLPLVVLPHGGPEERDEPGFDWWAQAYASVGYAVLQVNYRGSSGFGWDYLAAGFGQWGRKMQTDLSDGVRYLAAQGTIDPKRVCIVGGSYGGYAALAGAAIDRSVYRCAVSVAGVSDLKRMIARDSEYADDNGATIKRYWTRYMGPQEKLAEISPLQQADKVTIPVMLIHGKDDTVVNYEQSQLMADALRKAGKEVEFVTLKKEDHWLSSGETRLQMLQASVNFLRKHNPPD